MKKTNVAVNQTQNQQEKLIQKALRTGGFLFPETVDEVIEFEKSFGNTDVILPEDLQQPLFLETPTKKTSKAKIIALQEEKLAMAAREGSPKITEEVRKRMEVDRKKVDAKTKKARKK
ncbi:MAG: hypothetical protein Q7W13_15485 [Bacteroidia bacterium]|nr:hypothetical protein [Bacteroidia bacterium]